MRIKEEMMKGRKRGCDLSHSREDKTGKREVLMKDQRVVGVSSQKEGRKERKEEDAQAQHTLNGTKSGITHPREKREMRFLLILSLSLFLFF